MLEWAKKELARIEHDEAGFQDLLDKNVLELLETFCNQGHSNNTAPYVIAMFSRLAMYKPITPLTGEDDEWRERSGGKYQNKRYGAVFKDADGRAYNIEGKIFSYDNGKTWWSNKDSKVYIDFPYVVPDEPERVIIIPVEKKEKTDVNSNS